MSAPTYDKAGFVALMVENCENPNDYVDPDSFIDEALSQYNGDAPREGYEEIDSDGSRIYDLPSGYLAGAAIPSRVEYPIDQADESFIDARYFRVRDDIRKLVFVPSFEPANGEPFRLFFPEAHTLKDWRDPEGEDAEPNETTIPPQHFSAVAKLAAAGMAAALSSRYAHTRDPNQLTGGTSNPGKVNELLQLAKDLRAQYKAVVSPPPGESTPRDVVLNVDLPSMVGGPLLVHRPELR